MSCDDFTVPEPLILSSASKHGVLDDDIKHALGHYIDAMDAGDGVTMIIGPSRTGALLEVGVADWYDTLAVIHAMPARDRFLRR
jgi:hypothetical protein